MSEENNTTPPSARQPFQPGPWYESPRSARSLLENRLEQITDGIDAVFSVAKAEEEPAIMFICRALHANVAELRKELQLTLKWPEDQ
ncbi:MAG: hypothetical protein B7Y73_02980 [Acidocella sp. 35-58-6]|nr:MAG: hypothetical protein B7Y73_02980 [Acidocella sp. 35-58-6]